MQLVDSCTQTHRQLIPHAPLHHQTMGEIKSESQRIVANRIEWSEKDEKAALQFEEENKNKKGLEVCLCVCVCLRERNTHRSVYIHDHLSSSLVALAMVGSFLFLLQHTLSGGPVLQRKLAEDFTEPVDADLSHTVGRVTKEQQEGVEPERKKMRVMATLPTSCFMCCTTQISSFTQHSVGFSRLISFVLFFCGKHQ